MDYPEKLVIEPTTRCNFKCDMCVKQSSGCDIPEGDIDDAVFLMCDNLFPHLSSVVFTGIGEPLLHPNLETYLSGAENRMPADSVRGFQTNGKLLTPQRAVSLLESGMNQICISVDTVQPDMFDRVRQGGRLSDINQAFDALDRARKRVPNRPLQVGIECVLMKKNVSQLPLLVDWAAEREVDFIIVTHLTAYKKAVEDQIAYLNNSHDAYEMFESLKQEADLKGLDITRYDKILWKVNKSEKEIDIYNQVAAFKDAALKKDLYVNLFHLLTEVPGEYDRLRWVFDRTEEKAKAHGIKIKLPGIRPLTDRRCPFMEEKVMFVSWQGDVSPCYFLWHQYTQMRAGYTKYIRPTVFGNIGQTPPEKIWQDTAYRSFREKVLKYDYPNCHAWCETRCDYVLDDPFYQDCFINDIPCADCHWNLGLLNCLI